MRIARSRSAAHAARSPRFVDPATVAIYVIAGSTVAAVLNLDSTSCAPPDAQGNRACSFTASLPLGSQTYAFEATQTTLLNALTNLPDPSSVLSSALIPIDVQAGAPNIVRVSLGGVIAAVGVTLGANSALPSGTSADVPVIVSALDAAGNTIIGSDPYADFTGAPTPITVSTSDAVNAGLVVNASGAPGASVAVQSPGDAVTLHYTGAANVVSTVKASFTPPASAPPFGYTTSAATAFIGGGGFKPIVTSFPGDPLNAGAASYATSNTAIAAKSDGSGVVVAESNETLVAYDRAGAVTGRLDLSHSGSGGEPIVVIGLAPLNGKLIAFGTNGANGLQPINNLYAIDVTNFNAPIVGAPVPDAVDSFAAYPGRAGVVGSDGRLWYAPAARIDPTVGTAESLAAIDANLRVTLYPLPETANVTASVSRLCTGPFGRSIIARIDQVTSVQGGVLSLSGSDLGAFVNPTNGLSGLASCVTAYDNSVWFPLLSVPALQQAAGASDGSIGPLVTVSDIKGFVPTQFTPVSNAVAGSTATDAHAIYFEDASTGSNFLAFDTLTHVMTAVPTLGQLTILAPDGHGNFWGIDTGAGDPALTYIQVHP